MIWLRRKRRHRHSWQIVGWSGMFWLYRCETCGKEDI